MKKMRNLTIVVLVFLFVLPAAVQFGSNTTKTSIALEKTFTESYTHHDQIWIQNDTAFHAQAALESWDGDGSEETPYIITGYLFDCESQPLRIWHTTVHWIFTGNEIFGVGSNIQCGSWIENVTNGAIIDIEVHNRHAGLAIAEVDNLVITGNYIHDCWGRGIELFGAMANTIITDNVIVDIGQEGIYSTSSTNCIIENNTILDCEDGGIALMGTSEDCVVSGNNISHAEHTGILMANAVDAEVTDNIIANVGSHGVYVTSPTNCPITGNTISNVGRSGIRISGADNADISENVIDTCDEDGILVSSGDNSTIEWNSITNATGYSINLDSTANFFSVMYNTFRESGATCHVYDDGTSNVVSHNYYDDWDSPDDDGNGFVDTPYEIEGDSENQDEFPLAVAGIVPTTEAESSTTTTSGGTSPIPMDLLLIAGAVGAIVIVAGVLILKRR